MRRIRAAATARTRELLYAHRAASRRGMPVQDLLAEMDRGREQARQKLHEIRERTLEAQAGAKLRSGSESPWRSAAATKARLAVGTTGPRIVIVGAGLAGIRCAHVLWTGGKALSSTIYEAATDHIGGRCWSLRGFFENNLVTEHGGSFINHDEYVIRGLARSFGLEEIIVNGGNLPDRPEVHWIDGCIYTDAEANADWSSVGYEAFERATAAAPWPQSFAHHTEEGRRLDQLSVTEWLDEAGIGATSKFGRLMQQHAVSEFGGDPDDQSALNLLSLLGESSRNSLDPFPCYDEKYAIAGGNDQLASKMLEQLPGETVHPGHTLVRVKLESDRSYACTFEKSGGGTVTTTADYIVLTLPFRKLREVDLTEAGFSPQKMNAIKHLGFGSLGKIHVQLNHKPWVSLNYAGAAYSDLDSFGVVWDDSVHLGGGGAPSLLTIYPGAKVSESRLTLRSTGAHQRAPAQDVAWFLNEVQNIYPGVTQAYSGLAFEDNWANSPNHKGALAYWRVGQVTGFMGTEGNREGNALFAGEHTNKGDTGFMESAIITGTKAARTICLES